MKSCVRKISLLLVAIIVISTAYIGNPVEVNAGDYSAWSSVFDPAYYLANNAEAKAYAGNDVDKLWNYFINVGIPKLDQASAEFNPLIYAKNYPDLVSAFGSQYIQYYIHYAKVGKAEGRVASRLLNSNATATTPAAQTKKVTDPYGNVGVLGGRSIVVSVFVNDTTCSWTNSQSDLAMVMYELDTERIAVDYIKKEFAKYGTQSEFIYDFAANSDLMYTLNLNFNMRAGNYYYELKNAINSVVDVNALKAKYNADNVIILLFLNTDRTNTKKNSTYCNIYNLDAELEFAMMYARTTYSTGYSETLPSALAHEILHMYGAPDLYEAGEPVITQAYVNALEASKLKDIMRVTNFGRTINAEITPITAYYLGLTNYCEDVQKWGLGTHNW